VHQKRSKAALRRLAVEVREVDLGLSDFQRLCPYRLAEEHGIPVCSLEDLASYDCAPAAISYFTKQHPEAWSAALIPDGTGRVIVENPVHLPRRRRSNVTHEMAHLLLEHDFQCILVGEGETDLQDPASRALESEAAEFAAELLVPASAAVRAAVAGWGDGQVAEFFDVSIEMARWRMNVSGARTIARRAAAKKASPSIRSNRLRSRFSRTDDQPRLPDLICRDDCGKQDADP
jgi:hypothetical protein